MRWSASPSVSARYAYCDWVHIARLCTNFEITSATSMYGLFEKSELMCLSVGWGVRRGGGRCTLHSMHLGYNAPGRRAAGSGASPGAPAGHCHRFHQAALTKSLHYVIRWTCKEKSANDHLNVCIAPHSVFGRDYWMQSVVMILR